MINGNFYSNNTHKPTLLFWELNFQLTPDGGRLQRHVRAQYSPTYPVNVKRRSCRRSSHVRGHRDDQVIPLAVVGRACAPHHGLDRVVGVAGKRERLAPVVRCKPQNILILFSCPVGDSPGSSHCVYCTPQKFLSFLMQML
jgi:hypothetical protein